MFLLQLYSIRWMLHRHVQGYLPTWLFESLSHIPHTGMIEFLLWHRIFCGGIAASMANHGYPATKMVLDGVWFV